MKKALLFILPCLLTFPAFSQYDHDIGLRLGAANYLGEFGGKDETRRDFIYDMKMNQTDFSAGLFYRRRISKFLYINSGVNFGRIRGRDDNSTNRGRTGRNLSFRNDLWELNSRLEFVIYEERDVGGHYRHLVNFKTYVFGGLGLTFHNPKALYEGEWHKLRPLQTEGQTSKYSIATPAIPLGMGINFTVKKRYRFGWELGWRTTFTDYLDDASTSYASPDELGNDPLRIALANRNPELVYNENGDSYPDPAHYSPGNKRGDASHNDAYLFTTFNFSYVLRGKCRTCPVIRDRNYKTRSKWPLRWKRYIYSPKFRG